jgi:hypothetical protein
MAFSQIEHLIKYDMVYTLWIYLLPTHPPIYLISYLPTYYPPIHLPFIYLPTYLHTYLYFSLS